MQIMGHFQTVGSNQWHPARWLFTGAVGAPTIQSGVNNVLCLFSLSIFGRVEAPNLRPQVELEAWLVHDTGKPPSDSCSGSSIRKLKSILDGRNVKFRCMDNLSRDQFLQRSWGFILQMGQSAWLSPGSADQHTRFRRHAGGKLGLWGKLSS